MLGTVLFPLADTRRTTLSLLGWWESRRLTFNLAVGTAGLTTLVVVRLIAWLPPSMPMGFDWGAMGAVAAYGIVANVCYSLGWTIEALAQRVWGDKCPRFGPALFRQGLAFSVGLTLLPILVMSMGWLARVAWAVIHP